MDLDEELRALTRGELGPAMPEGGIVDSVDGPEFEKALQAFTMRAIKMAEELAEAMPRVKGDNPAAHIGAAKMLFGVAIMIDSLVDGAVECPNNGKEGHNIPDCALGKVLYIMKDPQLLVMTLKKRLKARDLL